MNLQALKNIGINPDDVKFTKADKAILESVKLIKEDNEQASSNNISWWKIATTFFYYKSIVSLILPIILFYGLCMFNMWIAYFVFCMYVGIMTFFANIIDLNDDNINILGFSIFVSMVAFVAAPIIYVMFFFYWIEHFVTINKYIKNIGKYLKQKIILINKKLKEVKKENEFVWSDN